MQGKWLLATGIAALLLGGFGSAYAAELIGSKDVRDRSLKGRDIAKNSVYSSNLSPGLRRAILSQTANSQNTADSRQGAQGPPGQQGGQGPQGQPGPQGPQGNNGANGSNGANGADGSDATLPSAGNWGVINRNTIGSPEQELRSGPFDPPNGTGALNLAVQGSGDGTASDPDFTPPEKSAWGNETDFVGDALSGIDQVGFWVWSSGENDDRGNPNMPNITIEVDRNGPADGAPGFSSLVFQPPNSPPNSWSGYIDAATTAASGSVGWYYTGTGNDCTQSAPCTLAGAKADHPDATIFTVAVGKGRDDSWQGAVDALRVNGTVFDFEEHGVTEGPA